VATVEQGETFPAKFGRTGFQRNWPFDAEWQGRYYRTKQIEAYIVDLAPDGTVYSIELLNASEQLGHEDMGKLLIVNEATGERTELPLAVG